MVFRRRRRHIVLAAFVLQHLYRVWPFLRRETSVFRIPDVAFKAAPAFAFVPTALHCILNVVRGGADRAEDRKP